jgi:hypothetical protein
VYGVWRDAAVRVDLFADELAPVWLQLGDLDDFLGVIGE